MDIFYRIVALLGGLALFLYGMRIMGDGLKSCSGGAMKAALAKVTDKPIKGFLLGMLVTAMIQSSTATIVLTVGLVGAGFLTFRQSTGIVLGANVGTAITAQIIRLMDVEAGAGSVLYFFKSDNLAPLALTLGIIMIMFVGKRRRNATAVGTICMGFGILFVGLMNMSSAVSLMSDSLSGLLVAFEDNPFYGFLAGTVVTGIIQSSSAVVGILQSVASSVGVRFCGVFAVIVGVNIGDCLTTYLVCRIGAKPEQIRTCLIHIIYNICAASLIFISVAALRLTGILGDEIWYATLKSGGVANIHGLFRLVPAVLLLPMTGLFARLAERLVPDRAEDEEDAMIEQYMRELDTRLVTNPHLALNETELFIGHMADVAMHNFTACIQQMFEYDPKRDQRIAEREDLLDRMADASNSYIVNLSPYITLEKDHRNQGFQYNALTCFERIGDAAMSINNNLITLREAGKMFSDIAQEDLKVATGAIDEILRLSTDAYKESSTSLARRVEPMEEAIDDLIVQLRENHVDRMIHHKCDVFSGIQLENILTNLGRIARQCSDLAVHLLSRTDDSIYGKEHEYLHRLRQSGERSYQDIYESCYHKYIRLLNLPVPVSGRKEGSGEIRK